MNKLNIIIILFFSGIYSIALGQTHGFEFGKVSYAELDMKAYDRDTSAVAVILDEFGDAYVDLDALNKIIFKYHVKIKILKEQGKKYADFELVRRKSNSSRFELIQNIKASSMNREGNSWRESSLQAKNIFDENVNADYSLVKFAVPDVQVGSVVEVSYELVTPYTFNFVPWEFQSAIPKIKSEFWAQFPAYYVYNITLKGFLPVTKNESTVIKQCIQSGVTAMGTSAGADCSQYKFGMEHIPAFKEEKYMTARRNFLSSINFELAQLNYPDGRVDKITTEWKETEKELKDHANFGVQIKRARNIYEGKVKEVMLLGKDELTIAQSLYDYFKNNFSWNGDTGFLTDNGTKKTEELKKGNTADINLSLLGALQEAKITAEPVLLSTRARGLPIKIHPVLSDFNYVLVGVKIKDEYFLLDATSPLHPFGFIPEDCLNGEGRAIWETSDWIPLKPNAKERTAFDLKLKLTEQGDFSGTVIIKHEGYAAFNMRKQFFSASDKQAYIDKRKARWPGLAVSNFVIENERDLDKAFTEKFDITFESITPGAQVLYFEPFIFSRIEKNPFTSTERSYPVDFGAPSEVIYLLSIDLPDSYRIDDLPEKVALAMPAGGGRYLFNVINQQTKVIMSSSLSLSKPVYTSDEYHYLRELYTQYIGIQQSQIVLKKK